ncbi:UNVERIFIED_CONTAM: Tetraspanin-9 [Gekko kuhli]
MTQVSESAKEDLKEGLKLYNSENNVGLKNAWNIIQAEMHCCGVTSYTDWYPVLGDNTVPDRCCMENSQDCGRNSTNTNLVWKMGCFEKVQMWFDDNKHIFGTVGMCILIMQVGVPKVTDMTIAAYDGAVGEPGKKNREEGIAWTFSPSRSSV